MNRIITGDAGGDQCYPFYVDNYKAETIGDFIQEVLKEFPDEWGTIRNEKYDIICEYRYGKICYITSDEEILKQEIYFITSYGGWSAMDYRIVTTD